MNDNELQGLVEGSPYIAGIRDRFSLWVLKKETFLLECKVFILKLRYAQLKLVNLYLKFCNSVLKLRNFVFESYSRLVWMITHFGHPNVKDHHPPRAQRKEDWMHPFVLLPNR